MQGAVPQQAAFPAAIQSAVARCGTGAAHGAVQGEALFTGGGVSGKGAVQGCCARVLCNGAVQWCCARSCANSFGFCEATAHSAVAKFSIGGV